MNKEIRIKGTAVSEGIGIGKIFFYFDSKFDEEIPDFPISLQEVDHEIARFRKALFSSKEELKRLQDQLSFEGSDEAVSLIDAHIQMLEDPFITVNIEDKIRLTLKNTESVFRSVIKDFEKQFSLRSTSFFRERLVDVKDVSRRVLGHLYFPSNGESLANIPRGSIVFAKELIPSHSAAAHPSQLAAYVTQKGGGNSHAALIARAKGIPYITNIEIEQFSSFMGEIAIVDGLTGEIIIKPDPETLMHYKAIRNQMFARLEIFEKEDSLSVETIDGYQLELYANIGSPLEFSAFPYTVSGVGLFRTEYLFLQKEPFFPSEEEQCVAYLNMINLTSGRPIVFRVFDVGGDKNPNLFSQLEEPNPVLGCRGIRFLIKNPEIFKTQVRAILKACTAREAKILLPLISDLEEVRKSKALIDEVYRELVLEGTQLPIAVSIGCMVEVPSSVMICDAIAKECDFLSMGTNDLIQYTLGIDRNNPNMNDLFYPLHPSIIRMIKMIVVAAQKEEKPLTICGHIASNKAAIPLLLGLGLREFSCPLRYIPMIKNAIRNCSLIDSYRLAEKILQLSDAGEISALLGWKTQNSG